MNVLKKSRKKCRINADTNTKMKKALNTTSEKSSFHCAWPG